MPDISTSEDIKWMMDEFYVKLLADDMMRPIFEDFAKIDMTEHMPILYKFWESILFQTHAYNGNAMKVHLDLHDIFPLEKVHFDCWLEHFNATIDERFEGPLAHKAKTRALSISTVIQMKR